MNAPDIAALYIKVGTTDAEEAALEAARAAEDYVPRCDVCGRRFDDSPAPFADGDWNGDTGNHETCERLIVVRFHWSDKHGECYECGLPAAFVLADRRGSPTRAIEDHHKRCAVCAANDAARGELIERIDPE